MGIFALACAGHSTIPLIRESMSEPSKFSQVVYNTFGTMAASYITLAAGGYYVFGGATQEMVSDNFDQSPDLRSHLFHPQLNFNNVLAVSILIHCVLLIPISIFAQQQIMAEILPTKLAQSYITLPS